MASRVMAHAAILLAVVALAGCRGSGAPVPASPGDRYTVRGQIVRLPEQDAASMLAIRHEAVPAFRDREGAVVGMIPMVMPFPIAKGVSLAGLAPGDKVRFRFVMDWNLGHYEIEFLEKLPPETVLDLGGAR